MNRLVPAARSRPIDHCLTFALIAALIASVITGLDVVRARARYRPLGATSLIGQPMPRLPDSTFAGSSVAGTVVVAVSESCRYCTDSIPYLRSLLAASRVRGIQAIVLSFDQPHLITQYVKTHDLLVDRLVHSPSVAELTEVIPAVFVVDGGGVVRGEWRGLLSSEAADALIAVLASDLMGEQRQRRE